MTLKCDELIELLKVKFPGFVSHWEAYLEKEGECYESILYADLGEFGDYVINWLPSMTDAELKDLFDYVEMLIVEGDKDLATAMCTGFLENLLNVDGERINFARCGPFLGPKSREYCLTWDTFCGYQSRWDKKADA